MLFLFFFKFLNKNNIKIGLFYRDCLWAFPEEYDALVSLPKRIVSKHYYKKDLNLYNKFIDKVYLPSLSMKNKTPVNLKNAKSVLTAGLDVVINKKTPPADKLRLFYVGVLNTCIYNLHLLLEVV